jgi:hypothetical protein
MNVRQSANRVAYYHYKFQSTPYFKSVNSNCFVTEHQNKQLKKVETPQIVFVTAITLIVDEVLLPLTANKKQVKLYSNRNYQAQSK